MKEGAIRKKPLGCDPNRSLLFAQVISGDPEMRYLTAPMRRLRKKTFIGCHRPSHQEQPDELGELFAGAPDGKLVVSRDAYHDLPPSVRGAFKRGDARIVVVDSEDRHSAVSAAADSCVTPTCSQQQLRGAAYSSAF